MQSCATKRVEYVYKVPAVTFPAFPAPAETSLDAATNTVRVPLEWYVDLAEYKANITAVERFYKLLSEAGEGAQGVGGYYK